jgi:rhodanese-related sulfurtransferase
VQTVKRKKVKKCKKTCCKEGEKSLLCIKKSSRIAVGNFVGKLGCDSYLKYFFGIYMGINFAGNIAPSEAWTVLSENKAAGLVDVRTPIETKFVGAADLSGLGKRVAYVPLVNSDGSANQNFAADIEAIGQDKTAPLFFICHGGGRSMQAAVHIAQLGYTTYNVEGGFCGDADANGQRGKINGWQGANLPWRQA